MIINIKCHITSCRNQKTQWKITLIVTEVPVASISVVMKTSVDDVDNERMIDDTVNNEDDMLNVSFNFVPDQHSNTCIEQTEEINEK